MRKRTRKYRKSDPDRNANVGQKEAKQYFVPSLTKLKTDSGFVKYTIQ